MQCFQTDHRQQCRNDRNEEGKNGVADQNDSYVSRIADITDRASDGFEEALQRKLRDIRSPRRDSDNDQQSAEAVQQENRIGSDEKQKHSTQGWTSDARDVHLQPTKDSGRRKVL